MSSPEALVSKPHETPSSASASPPASAPAPTPTAPAPTPTPTPAPVPPSASPTFTSSLHSSMSPSVPFYEKRSVGRVFGTLLMASGTLPAYYFYKKLQYLAALLGGVFPVAVGMYLISKPYLKDPEALKDYRNEYDSSPLAAGVREKSWTVSYLLNFVAPYEIKAKFLEEVGTSNGLEKIWKLYGKDFLGELLKMEVVSRTFFEEQFLVDRSNAKTVFSSEPFIDRVNLYGVWLVDNAKVKAETVASALDNDPKTLALTFPELVQKGSRKLLGRKLISVRALHVPCMSELSRIGFGKMETKYGRWWLDEGVVTPEDASHYFRIELHGMQNVVDLIEKYWEWPIQKYGSSIEVNVDEYEMLKELHNKLEKGREVFAAKKGAIDKVHSSECSDAQNEYKLVVHKAISAFDASLQELGQLHATDSKRYGQEKKELEKTKKSQIAEAEVAKRRGVSRADAEKASDLAALKANWSRVQDQLDSNWRHFVRGEPLVDVDISLAGSLDTSRSSNSSSNSTVVQVHVAQSSPPPSSVVYAQPPPNGNYSPQPQHQYQQMPQQNHHSNSFNPSAPPPNQ
eukprot:TRINITY_DN2129_c0_g1_i2.p1 TRINITY_DN2129_c0_g1~~TRINITY_DN2129_c0_g1_i2.p1  ORF type:complete len:570 (+),score=122.50 TRINITY_DN2129_c0_g1_i2:71-1780(+)